MMLLTAAVSGACYGAVGGAFVVGLGIVVPIAAVRVAKSCNKVDKEVADHTEETIINNSCRSCATGIAAGAVCGAGTSTLQTVLCGYHNPADAMNWGSLASCVGIFVHELGDPSFGNSGNSQSSSGHVWGKGRKLG